MRIVFLLPGSGDRPVGGYKVVYEYANGLGRRGHDVMVVHAPYCLVGDHSPGLTLRNWANYSLRSAGAFGGFRPDKWFSVDPRVRMLWVPSLNARWIPDADVVVATAWGTAEHALEYPESKGLKFYLIQHSETIFSGADAVRVEATWHAPMHRIVIARWLYDLLEARGLAADYIPNGLDFQTFGVDIPPDRRCANRVLMLHHSEPWKGTAVGIAALEQARAKAPEIAAALFGVMKPASLPSWIKFYENPRQARLRELYNDAAIFIAPSLVEGWGLPSAEAMQCGAALCGTDIGGHREFAVHEMTALLAPPNDADALARNIVRLVTDPELRIRIAKAGLLVIKNFTWQRSVPAMEASLMRAISRKYSS